MNRRNFLTALGATSVMMYLQGCKTTKKACELVGICNPVYMRETVDPSHSVVITSDTSLNRNYEDTVFTVRNGAELDCNGFTIDGRVGDKVIANAVRLFDSNTSIKNGNIRNFASGIVCVSGMTPSQHDALTGISVEEATTLGVLYRKNTAHGQRISNMLVADMDKHATYVTRFSNGAVIEGCEFRNIGTMGTYIDAGASHTLVRDSSFNNCGYNHSRGREGVAVDATLDSVIERCSFANCSLGGIMVYTNWGEGGITREINYRTHVVDCSFESLSKGVSIASRHQRRFAGATADDHAKECSVSDCTFEKDVMLPIEYLDTPFTEYNNSYTDGSTVEAIWNGGNRTS